MFLSYNIQKNKEEIVAQDSQYVYREVKDEI